MRERVSVVSKLVIPAPAERVRTAVWDIKNIERCEVKADVVNVTKRTPVVGSYTVRGHFAGLPWRGEFFYELNPKGFHSKNAPRPGRGSTIEGGFVVEPITDNECLVVHYEDYRLPAYFRPLRVAIEVYLRWSMRRELDDLERLVADGEHAVRAEVRSRAPVRRLRTAQRRSPRGLPGAARR